MSYGPDVIDLFRSGATYVDRIIKADLPIQQPTKYELVNQFKSGQCPEYQHPSSITFPRGRVS